MLLQKNIPEVRNNNVPELFGKKEQIIILHPGFQIILGDFNLAKRKTFHFYSSEDVCEFAFVLSGEFNNKLSGAEDIKIKPLFSALWLTPRLEGHHDCCPNSNIRFVCIRLNRLLLAEILGGFLFQVPEDFRLILEKKQNGLYYRFSEMTIPMQAAVRQIFQCPYHGAMKKLFLESKALELISHFMVFHFGEKENKKESLPEKQKNLIVKARDILIKNMEHPLSLPELARSAGISETKLTRGFRKVYKTSVFEYLRNQRMEKAKMLLESGNVNITEVAYIVGYSSPSHFTRNFIKYYNVTPRAYLMGFNNPN